MSPNGPTLSITESNEHRQLTHPHNKCPFGRAFAFSSKCLMMHLAFKRSDQIRAAVKENAVIKRRPASFVAETGNRIMMFDTTLISHGIIDL